MVIHKRDGEGQKLHIKVAGYDSCGFFHKANQLISCLQVIFPDTILHEEVKFSTRDEFKAWIVEYRKLFGSNAQDHGSSPFVTINDKYLGGCDDTISWAQKTLLFKDDLKACKEEEASQHIDYFDPNHNYDFDLIVIGGNRGGLSCAKEAAKLGARVCLVDMTTSPPAGGLWDLGGLYRGFIPRKLFNHVAVFCESLDEMSDFGCRLDHGANNDGNPHQQHAWETLRESVKNQIRSLHFEDRVGMRDHGVVCHNGTCRLTNLHEIETMGKNGEGPRRLTAARFVLALDSQCQVLDCPGGDLALNSDDLFSLTQEPGKTCIIGADCITALEYAGFLRACGYDVTLLLTGSSNTRLLPSLDKECADRIVRSLQEDFGVKIVLDVHPIKVEKTKQGMLLLQFSNGQEDVFNTVLSAQGRVLLDLEGLGFKEGLGSAPLVNPKTGRLVCHQGQTSVSHIYAIGNVVDGGFPQQLTCLSAAAAFAVQTTAGSLLARRLFAPQGGGTTWLGHHDDDHHPVFGASVCTPLQYGFVGLSEEGSKEKYGEDDDKLEVYRSSLTPAGWRGLPEDVRTRAFMKVLVLRNGDAGGRVVGMHYCGPHATEIMQGYSVAFKAGMTYEDLINTPGIHPTISQEINNLRKSPAQSSRKTAKN